MKPNNSSAGKLINYSALSFLALPILGVIVPYLLWKNRTEHFEVSAKVAKEVVNFQVTWCIMLTVGVMVNSLIQMNEGELSLVTFIFTNFLFIVFMYILNVFQILRNALKIKKGKDLKYSPKITFLK